MPSLQDPFTFADKVASDSSLSMELIEGFVNKSIEVMSPEQIKERLRYLTKASMVADLRHFGPEILIQDIAEHFPEMLVEKGVDLSPLNLH